MRPGRSEFTRKEWRCVQSHSTPARVQRWLSNLPYNWQPKGATCFSFRGVVAQNRAQCLEGALAAATILEQHGHPPLLVSIESWDMLDHVLFLFKEKGRYGAIARSRLPALHGRKPVFRRVRDLVMSYYDPYIDKTGRITGYAVADLRVLGAYDWRLSPRNVWKVDRFLCELPHREIRGSDARYAYWHRRYQEFKKHHPTQEPDFYDVPAL